jgi:cytochrome b561
VTPTRYSKSAIILHWGIAAAIGFQIGLGEEMEHAPPGPGKWDVAQFHKTVGITILLLTLLRVGVRMVKPRPAALGDKNWAQRLASVTHFGLYAFMILAPLTGWLAASTSRYAVPTDLFGIVHFPNFPFVGGIEGDAKHDLHELMETVHGLLSKVGFALLALHVLGALRHQFLLKEALIERMLPTGAALPRLVGTGLIIAFAAAFLALVQYGQVPGLAPKSVFEAPKRLPAAAPATPSPSAEVAR